MDYLYTIYWKVGKKTFRKTYQKLEDARRADRYLKSRGITETDIKVYLKNYDSPMFPVKKIALGGGK